MITSLQFPKMIVGKQVQVVRSKPATMQNLKLLLLSKRGEFFGDPEYGSGIEQDLYKFNNTILRDILKDQIYVSVCNYFPQLKLSTKDITITVVSKTTLKIEFTAFNDDTQEDNMFNLDLAISG